MKKYQGGTSLDLAEIIIDYDKKDVKIIDAKKGTEIKDLDLSFDISPIAILFLVIYFPFLFILSIMLDSTKFFLFLINLPLTFYMIYVLSTPLRKKWHQIEQKVFNDKLKTKNFMIVKGINKKIWKLPYDFSNIKFDYNLYRDYAKYIKKVHIRPKDYYWFRVGKEDRKKQQEEWEAIFYFKKIPVKGKMEIVWI